MRFGATLLGSRAIAGTLDLKVLDAVDRDGISMADALRNFGLDPAQVTAATRRREELLAYVNCISSRAGARAQRHSRRLCQFHQWCHAT